LDYRKKLYNDALFLIACAVAGTCIGTGLGQCAAHAEPQQVQKPIRVAILDAGLGYTPELLPLCEEGHRDFTGEGITDFTASKHGNNVAALIAGAAGRGNYCLVILKVFKGQTGNSTKPYIAALHDVYRHGYEVVNLSLSGTGSDLEEYALLRLLLDKGVHVQAAAGNQGYNLDELGCVVFPACADRRITVVGAYDVQRSNVGLIVDVIGSGKDKRAGGVSLSGTSQATALHTGQVVRRLLSKGRP
jgi:hypothetical protein